MPIGHPFRFHRLAIIGLCLLFFVCIGWVLPGITIQPSPQSLLSKLKAAQALWDKQNVSSYRMDLGFGAPFTFIGDFNVTVQNNRVVKVETANPRVAASLSSPAEIPDWYAYSFARFFPPTLEGYTIDQLFDFAAQKIKNEPVPPVVEWCGSADGKFGSSHYEAAFNSEEGYLTSLSYTACVHFDYGFGFLCPIVTDCSIGFTVRNLQPIN